MEQTIKVWDLFVRLFHWGLVVSLAIAWLTAGEWVEESHETLANMMLIMLALHIAGLIYASLRHTENLVWAMLNVRKRTPGASDVA